MAFTPVVNDLSSNYFARYGQNGGVSTASAKGRSDQAKALEAQAKEQDKQQAEEAKRLRQILVGHGVPKGQAEGMSVGELKGTLDTWTMKHARRLEAEKVQRGQEQQQFENDRALQREFATAQELEQRGSQYEQQEAARVAKAQAEAEAVAREQRALQAGMTEGSIQGGEGMFAGPVMAPGVSPVNAAARGYLGAGGMEPQAMRALGEVFTPPDRSEPKFFPGPNGSTIVDLGNGQRQLVKAQEEEQESANVYPTSAAAMAAAKADGFPENRVGVKPKAGGWTYSVSTGATDRYTEALKRLQSGGGAATVPSAGGATSPTPAKRSVLDSILTTPPTPTPASR